LHPQVKTSPEDVIAIEWELAAAISEMVCWRKDSTLFGDSRLGAVVNFELNPNYHTNGIIGACLAMRGHYINLTWPKLLDPHE